MNSPKKKSASASVQPSLDLISLAKLTPELARHNLRSLLLANPNYFGNLGETSFKAVLQTQEDTAYESLSCVGYNPQSEQLRATLHIKKSSGYSGDLCSAGSHVSVFDVSGPKPLEYAVTLPIGPKEELCFLQNLPRARAILSWNLAPPPASPNWSPIWGNVLESHIQIDGFKLIPLGTLLAEAKVQLPEQIAQSVDPGQPMEAAVPKALLPVELHQLYERARVPQHRYLAPLLAAASVSEVAAEAATTATVAKAMPKASFAGIADIDLAKLVGTWLNTRGDTSFEQLSCIGLDSNFSQLTGVLQMKKSSGYAGGSCTTGSKEFVAFWVDWSSGWQYAGTTSVVVHDYSSIPAGGLAYSVFLPINLLSHAQPCENDPKTAKVRAVLSWNVPPSITNPYAPVVWGNSLDGNVLVPSGQLIGTGQQVPVLGAVGGIDTAKIGSDGRITDAFTFTTGVHYVGAPFGGRITLAGKISNPVSGLRYRLMKAPHGSSAFVPVINEPAGLTLTIYTFSGGVWTNSQQTFHADADGYYLYQDYSVDHFVEGQLLGVWYTTPADSGYAFDLRVDLSAAPGPDIQSNIVNVLVNNVVPVAKLIPSFGVCGKVAPGNTISGVFTTTAADFGSFSFSILPPDPAHGVLPAPPSGVSMALDGTIADPGVVNQVFTLNTAGMDPCGYALQLNVWDRTNVNSGQTRNYNQDSAGFCLQTGS